MLRKNQGQQAGIEFQELLISKFLLRQSSDYKSLFEQFEIDIKEYQLKYSDDKKNYSGLKDKPILKSNQDTYIVFNWNFITNKLYNGLVFDFYKIYKNNNSAT